MLKHHIFALVWWKNWKKDNLDMIFEQNLIIKLVEKYILFIGALRTKTPFKKTLLENCELS